MASSEQFVVRPYRQDDEDWVVSAWLRAYCNSEYGRERGANVRASKARDAFWSEQRCTVMALIERCETHVLVDAAEQDAIWAFACSSPGVLHFAAAKTDFPTARRRKFIQALVDFSVEKRYVTHEIPEFRALFGGIPSTWTIDSRLITPALLGHFK